jgi:hypothetical protein
MNFEVVERVNWIYRNWYRNLGLVASAELSPSLGQKEEGEREREKVSLVWAVRFN